MPNIETIFMWVTNVSDLLDRSKIIAEYHNSPLAGHPGESKTIELIQHDFNWDTLEDDVRAVEKGVALLGKF
jgi:hypothetical protein